MKNKLAHTENALKGAKRKLDNAHQQDYGKGKKGKGKGGKRRGGNGHVDNMFVPAEFRGMLTQINGDRICYSFQKNGCSLSQTGAKCPRGVHLCIKCGGPHPLSACTK